MRLSLFAQVDSTHVGILWVGPSWHCLGGSKLALFGWVQVGLVLHLKFCWRRIGLCLFGSFKGEAVGVTYTPHRKQDELKLLALAGVVKTQAKHIADSNDALVDLVAHHRLALPLLTPSVVQTVWEMYQEETGTATFPFSPEMVYEAAASYAMTEETIRCRTSRF